MAMACRRQMWPGLIQKAKDGGLDVIETYVFWDIHEPVRGQARTNTYIISSSPTSQRSHSSLQ